MTDAVVRCSNCGAPIAKRDCRCKGDGKLMSGWTTEEPSEVAEAPVTDEVADAAG